MKNTRSVIFDKMDIRPFVKFLLNFKDIYDGEVYKEQENNGYFDQQSSISFRIFTDGVRVFKSSKTDIWPVYLTINELPRSQRFLKENVIFAGLWCGSVKSVGNILLAPLREQLTELHAGVPMYSPDAGRINVKGVINCGTGNTPARELIMNINLHVGYCSCTRCKARGERIANVQTFPYEPQVELRTVAGMRQDAVLAMNLPRNAGPSHVNGVNMRPGLHGLETGDAGIRTRARFQPVYALVRARTR